LEVKCISEETVHFQPLRSKSLQTLGCVSHQAQKSLQNFWNYILKNAPQYDSCIESEINTELSESTSVKKRGEWCKSVDVKPKFNL
jgi:hypothetical protein